MSATVVADGERSFAPLWSKIFVVAAIALAALILYVIDRLPSAVDLDQREWEAPRRSELAIYGLPAGQLLEFNGKLGAGLDVRAPVARPSPAMLTELQEGDVTPPKSKAVALSWNGHTDPGGRINLVIVNQRDHPDAGVALAATGSADIPQLRLTAIRTALTVTMSAFPGDSEEVPLSHLKLDNEAVQQPLASLIPVSVEIPPGEPLLLTFPSAEAMADVFRLGRLEGGGEIETYLPIRRFEIGSRRPGATLKERARVRRGVCAARSGRFHVGRLALTSEDCSREELTITDMEVSPQKVAIDVAGSGFVIDKGRPVAAGVLSQIARVPLISILLGFVYTAFATWGWKKLTGLNRP